MNLARYIDGKHVLIVGVGQTLAMVRDIIWMREQGAKVHVYEPRREARIPTTVHAALVGAGIPCVFGESKDIDVSQVNVVVMAPYISPQLPIIERAVAAGALVYTPLLLLLALSPPVTLIGVCGTYGKRTVAHYIHALIKGQIKDDGGRIVLYNPEDDAGVCALMKKIRSEAVVIAPLPYQHLPFCTRDRLCPQVGVVTTLVGATPSQINDVAHLLNLQTYNNFIVAPDAAIDTLRKASLVPSGKMLRTSVSVIKQAWGALVRGVYKENVALAARVAELFRVNESYYERIIPSLKPLTGRLERLRLGRGIEVILDSEARDPYATLAALTMVAGNKNAVLIIGGIVPEEGIEAFLGRIEGWTKHIILLAGPGTARWHRTLLSYDRIAHSHASSIEEAVTHACAVACTGDVIIFSPGASLGVSHEEVAEGFRSAIRAAQPSNKG
jgi:UDP-N-acetylmuramoylalanine-D-glutamate ligase